MFSGKEGFNALLMFVKKVLPAWCHWGWINDVPVTNAANNALALVSGTSLLPPRPDQPPAQEEPSH